MERINVQAVIETTHRHHCLACGWEQTLHIVLNRCPNCGRYFEGRKTMKVYCENCKYFKVARSGPLGFALDCFYCLAFSIEDQPHRRRQVRKVYSKTQNAKNDCSWYRRKWWKFFSKEDDK